MLRWLEVCKISFRGNFFYKVSRVEALNELHVTVVLLLFALQPNSKKMHSDARFKKTYIAVNTGE